MAGDRDIQRLTEVVKENTRAFKELTRAATALNTNLVALVNIQKEDRARAAEVGLSGS